MYKTKKKLEFIINVFLAIFVRCTFIIMMLFSIWAASCVTDQKAWWALIVFVVLLLIEGIYNVIKRKGQEPKWFSHSIFIFLLAVVPPIWLLNLDMLECLKNHSNNQTICNGLNEKSEICSIISVNSYFNRKPLAYTLEEITLLLLVVGKWLMPKGSVTSDQHSQLLFIYFGFAYDIMDIFLLFQDLPEVFEQKKMIYAILAIWTLSLFQFTLVVTATKRKKVKLNEADNRQTNLLIRCCMSEIWSLMTNVIMHDGPFLILRLYCIIHYKSFTYNLLFYLVKNLLIIMLQFYRLGILVIRCRNEIEEEQSIGASTLSLPRHDNYNNRRGLMSNNANDTINTSENNILNRSKNSNFYKSNRSIDSVNSIASNNVNRSVELRFVSTV